MIESYPCCISQSGWCCQCLHAWHFPDFYVDPSGANYSHSSMVWAPEDVPDVVGEESSSGDDEDDEMMDE
jgi:hypothetical protein